MAARPITIAYVALAFISVPMVFLWSHDLTVILWATAFSGIFVSGQYTWMAAWLPELFPTRVRATATAFVFNTPRLIAWTGPLISGWLIANFGGFSTRRGRHRLHLYRQPRGGAVPAGNAGQAAAGVAAIATGGRSGIGITFAA